VNKKTKFAKDKTLAKEIKEMEVAKKQEAIKKAPKAAPVADVRVSFDQWWMLLVKKITIRPSYKEILIADFKARGIGKKALAEEYDKALELYGIKL